MSNVRPPYSQGYRRRIMKLVRTGRTPQDLAKKYPPSAKTIRNWVKHELYVDAVARFNLAIGRPRSFPPGGWLGGLLEPRRRYEVQEVVTILRDWGTNPEPKVDPFGWFILSASGSSMYRSGKTGERKGRIDTFQQLCFLPSILENGPIDVIKTLLRANDLPSRRALKRVLRFGRMNEHHNFMAIVWNQPLRQLRGLIAQHPRYRVEFRERSIP